MPTLLLRAFVLFALASLAPAQGLVQLSLGGKISEPGGARVEIEVGAEVEGVGRQVTLALFLARGTSGADLAQLVSARLTRAGFDVLAPAPGREEGALAHVFVESTFFVRTRLGGGLTGSITTSETAPSEVRLEAAESSPADMVIQISASTRSPHTKKSSRRRFEVGVKAEDHAAQAINKIHEAALASDWMGDRPTAHAWRPVRMVDGSVITGFSIGLETAGDWRLEVKLPRGEDR